MQEVTSRKDQAQYWAGEAPYRYVTPDEFAAAFWQSADGDALREQLARPPARWVCILRRPLPGGASSLIPLCMPCCIGMGLPPHEASISP